jgi:hypothetical protein
MSRRVNSRASARSVDVEADDERPGADRGRLKPLPRPMVKTRL